LVLHGIGLLLNAATRLQLPMLSAGNATATAMLPSHVSPTLWTLWTSQLLLCHLHINKPSVQAKL
jgi:hypothetical protein